MDSSVTQIIHEKHIDRIGEAHDLARIYQRIQIQHTSTKMLYGK